NSRTNMVTSTVQFDNPGATRMNCWCELPLQPIHLFVPHSDKFASVAFLTSKILIVITKHDHPICRHNETIVPAVYEKWAGFTVCLRDHQSVDVRKVYGLLDEFRHVQQCLRFNRLADR